MGRHLQVRVAATTYRPEDLEKDWPKLCALAWPVSPEDGGVPMEQRGVVELVDTLFDCLRFVVADKALQEKMMPVLKEAVSARMTLDEALEAWYPKQSEKFTNIIEELLDKLETLAPEPAFVISGKQPKKKRKAPWHRLIR